MKGGLPDSHNLLALERACAMLMAAMSSHSRSVGRFVRLIAKEDRERTIQVQDPVLAFSPIPLEYSVARIHLEAADI